MALATTSTGPPVRLWNSLEVRLNVSPSPLLLVPFLAPKVRLLTEVSGLSADLITGYSWTIRGLCWNWRRRRWTVRQW